MPGKAGVSKDWLILTTPKTVLALPFAFVVYWGARQSNSKNGRNSFPSEVPLIQGQPEGIIAPTKRPGNLYADRKH